MPFEPSLPSPYQYLFHGHIQTAVTDPDGTPAATIISMTDTWYLKVDWQVHGLFVPSIGGKWVVRAYLESIGPGPEDLVAEDTLVMDGKMNYTTTFKIKGQPTMPGAYKLVTVITSSNLLGTPAPFAAYDEGPILQFYAGPSLPPVPPTP